MCMSYADLTPIRQAHILASSIIYHHRYPGGYWDYDVIHQTAWLKEETFPAMNRADLEDYLEQVTKDAAADVAGEADQGPEWRAAWDEVIAIIEATVKERAEAGTL